jgi:hypothetical protein
LADHKDNAHKSRGEEGGAGAGSARLGKEREEKKEGKDHSWKMTGTEKLAKIKRDFEARRASGTAARGEQASLGLLRNILPDIKATPVVVSPRGNPGGRGGPQALS